MKRMPSPEDARGTNQEPRLLRRLLRAKDRMDAASHEDWPVRRLALVSGVSEAHFARSFKLAFGIPPHRYLLTRRIERATATIAGSRCSTRISRRSSSACSRRVRRCTTRQRAEALRAIVAKGAMPPLVLTVDDCRAAHDKMSARGVEFTQEPAERYGSVDAGFRDPSGNGWKMIQARR